LIFVFLVVLFAPSSFANNKLDSVIAPHIGTIRVNETRINSATTEAETLGYRYTLRADFMSLSNHVSINLLSAIGANYWDIGAQLRVFDMATLRSLGSSGVLYGVGAGLSYSPGYKPDPLIAETAPFTETMLTAFMRFQWDTRSRWGVFMELAYEGSPSRTLFIKNDQGERESFVDSKLSHRLVLSLGIPFEFKGNL
jgi:hypothetical protein